MPGASERVLTLVGLSGTGKSTVARLLANRWSWSWVDLDAEIAARADRSIPEIFQAQGERVFRALEQDALTDALRGIQVILSTGGGAPCTIGAMDRILAAGPAIWLRASPDELVARLDASEERPLLPAGTPPAMRALLEDQLAERAPIYVQATAQVDTDDRTVLQVALAIEELLGGTRDGPWRS